MQKIGLIAGNRKFPLLFAQEAKNKGCSIVAVAIKGETSSQLSRIADKMYWLRLREFQKLFDIFHKEGITQVVMAGQISPAHLFGREVRQSKDLQEILAIMKDKRANTIFSVLADRLQARGLHLIDSTTFIDSFLPDEGQLTSVHPSGRDWEDIYFGMKLAKEVARLDIGLTVAVKHKAIVAVEALEGTDNLIRRAGKIARGGIVVVKVSRPNQDMRFDIPVIGLRTVQTLIRAKAACLAIEARKTLFIDQPESIALADKKHLAIVAV